MSMLCGRGFLTTPLSHVNRRVFWELPPNFTGYVVFVQGSPFKFIHMFTLKQNQDFDKVASKHPEDKKMPFQCDIRIGINYYETFEAILASNSLRI